MERSEGETVVLEEDVLRRHLDQVRWEALIRDQPARRSFMALDGLQIDLEGRMIETKDALYEIVVSIHMGYVGQESYTVYDRDSEEHPGRRFRTYTRGLFGSESIAASWLVLRYGNKPFWPVPHPLPRAEEGWHRYYEN